MWWRSSWILTRQPSLWKDSLLSRRSRTTCTDGQTVSLIRPPRCATVDDERFEWGRVCREGAASCSVFPTDWWTCPGQSRSVTQRVQRRQEVQDRLETNPQPVSSFRFVFSGDSLQNYKSRLIRSVPSRPDFTCWQIKWLNISWIIIFNSQGSFLPTGHLNIRLNVPQRHEGLSQKLMWKVTFCPSVSEELNEDREEEIWPPIWRQIKHIS